MVLVVISGVWVTDDAGVLSGLATDDGTGPSGTAVVSVFEAVDDGTGPSGTIGVSVFEVVDDGTGNSGTAVVVGTESAVDTGVDAGSEAVVSPETSETGQTVVETAMVEVTTVVDSAGQLTTSGAQLVMVATEVEKMVDVVISTDDVGAGGNVVPGL